MYPIAFLFTGMVIWKNWVDKKDFFKQPQAKERTSS